MQTAINANRPRPFAALLVVCVLLALPGCKDQLLPVEPTGGTGGSARIIFSEINDTLEWLNDAVVSRIDADGSARVDLTDGFLIAPPGAAGIAILRADNGVWHAEVTGSSAVTPRLVAAGRDRLGDPGSIDPLSVATAPNGLRVTYTTYTGRATTIAGVGGDSPVTLPRPVARESTPSFSPDGSRLAFFSADSTTSSDEGGLYVVNVDGTGLRLVASLGRIAHDGYSSIDWSPSGDRLAYFCQAPNDPEIRVVGIDGSGARTLGPGIYPVWSPSGDSILYSGVASVDLFMMAADGSGTPRRLTATPTEADVYAQFSPDGRKILYTAITGHLNETPGALKVLDLASGAITVLSRKAFKAFWVR